jgi:hypothetical protein
MTTRSLVQCTSIDCSSSEGTLNSGNETFGRARTHRMMCLKLRRIMVVQERSASNPKIENEGRMVWSGLRALFRSPRDTSLTSVTFAFSSAAGARHHELKFQQSSRDPSADHALMTSLYPGSHPSVMNHRTSTHFKLTVHSPYRYLSKTAFRHYSLPPL